MTEAVAEADYEWRVQAAEKILHAIAIGMNDSEMTGAIEMWEAAARMPERSAFYLEEMAHDRVRKRRRRFINEFLHSWQLIARSIGVRVAGPWIRRADATPPLARTWLDVYALARKISTRPHPRGIGIKMRVPVEVRKVLDLRAKWHIFDGEAEAEVMRTIGGMRGLVALHVATSTEWVNRELEWIGCKPIVPLDEFGEPLTFPHLQAS